MKFNSITFSYFFTLVALVSFFLGFSLDEVSMGAGGFDGDFKFVKKSIALFNENSLFESIKLFSETSNRPPLIYLMHKYLNPFFINELGFRRTVFIISLAIPILFFFCLKEKFPEVENKILIFFSSIIFFNPFIRTSSYWGLEENYAIITMLASILVFLKFSKINSYKINYKLIFLLTLFSSLTIYFDQKFFIIPLIFFLNILFGKFPFQSKAFTIFCYSIFSIPYIFLIILWGGIFPSNIYHIGKQFYFHHLGYALTIIAFIFFPFVFLKSTSIKEKLTDFIKNKKILLILLSIILFYLVILFFFYDDTFINNHLDGGGIVKKISLVFFEDIFFRKLFIFFSVFFSWFFIFFFLDKYFFNFFLTLYFLLFSAIVRPFYQEYFDPIILLLLIFLYKIDFKINLERVYFLYFYFLLFLIGTNIYYN